MEEAAPTKVTRSIDFVGLDRLITNGRNKMVIMAPRRSGLTTNLRLCMELMKHRKPWLTIQYRNLTNPEECDTFIPQNEELFSIDDSQARALFIDQGLHAPIEKLRDLINSTQIRYDYIYIFNSGLLLDSRSNKFKELTAYGFEVVNAPQVLTVANSNWELKSTEGEKHISSKYER